MSTTEQATTEQPTADKKAISPVNTLRSRLDRMAKQFETALPKHIEVERFTRNIMTAVQQMPELLDCDQQSLISAAMTAAHLGLMVGQLGQAWIIPFNVKGKGRLATFIIGYRGYITLARNSGEVTSLYAYEVCEKDLFEYELGLHLKCEHKPATGDRGPITYVYCVVHFKDGGHHVEVMTKADVDVIRSRSKAPNSPAWRNDYMMMARKTVIRRAAKYMPLDVQRAAAVDAAYEIDRRRAFIIDEEVVIEGEASEVSDEEAGKNGAERLEDFAAQGQAKQEAAGEDTPEPKYSLVSTISDDRFDNLDAKAFSDAFLMAAREHGKAGQAALEAFMQKNDTALNDIERSGALGDAARFFADVIADAQRYVPKPATTEQQTPQSGVGPGSGEEGAMAPSADPSPGSPASATLPPAAAEPERQAEAAKESILSKPLFEIPAEPGEIVFPGPVTEVEAVAWVVAYSRVIEKCTSRFQLEQWQHANGQQLWIIRDHAPKAADQLNLLLDTRRTMFMKRSA
jgi:recombination protein RecT